MRAQSSCFVQEGDLPLEIHWEKNSQRLRLSANVKVNQLDDFTFILTITEAVSEDAGNYSCVATNAAGAVATFAVLTVNVPPSWMLPPHDVSIPLGGSAVVPCSAKGFPLPQIEWQRQTGGNFIA
ncbi:hypothetical protein HAZT_HAZT010785 [Hyalella azteca]|uniref:Ig-like domain-containing protein n=1 Tax=Hyalella azteca TaxID=294128 RepID=A0A6A0GNL1_HYAAZ|nr:hypothetical protein HAZT_HAZT010785 [Hyalella azteca]